MSKLDEAIAKPHLAYRPDAQPFDEIRLRTVPRYKTSGLSGDEWRIHVQVDFLRNGEVKHSVFGGHNIEKAIVRLGHLLCEAIDEGHAYFAGEEDWCDQEGCCNTATVWYRVKTRVCSDCGIPKETAMVDIRKFCEEHKRRGDCGLDDADRNYERIRRPQT